MRIAVVGGGPGGLMAARLIEQRAGGSCEVTVFEASSRLGGKIQTRRFEAAPAVYEAGVAECYDLEAFGRDPLKDLVRELGLRRVPTHSQAVALDGVILRDDAEAAAHCGERTWAAVERFRRQAAAMMPSASWPCGNTDARHPWAHRSCEDLLDEVDDALARRYLRVVMHSDLATEPHLTNGIVGLRHVLKNTPGYGAQYTIDGGMEMLPRRLAARLTVTRVHLGARVARVAGDGHERYTIDIARGRALQRQTFDGVVLALPYNELHGIRWMGEGLRRALTRHVARYDRPAHYLRISILFDHPFWRHAFGGSWLMLDAFGGCCVYDERPGSAAAGHGVLGWLLAGTDALTHANADDATLVGRAIDSLPDGLHDEARRSVVEGRVHRWVGALSGTPGAVPDLRAAHRPEPREHRRLVVVGDYLFDSTLNGVLRSAHVATDLLLEEREGRGRGPSCSHAA